MSTVTVKHPHSNLPEVRQFTYTHNARSWLLLAGYLPLLPQGETTDEEYEQPYTGSTAVLHIQR